MTLSAIAVPSVAMRVASHAGTRPPWSGRSALPERFTRSLSHLSEAAGRRRCRHRPCGLVRLHSKRETDTLAHGVCRGHALTVGKDVTIGSTYLTKPNCRRRSDSPSLEARPGPR